MTMKAAARMLQKYWPEIHHSVAGIEHAGIGFAAIVVENGRVVDGNHRLMAMIRMGYKGPVVRIDYIKGSGKGEENWRKLLLFWDRKKKGRWQ